MKFLKLALATAMSSAVFTGSADAQGTAPRTPARQTAHTYNYYAQQEESPSDVPLPPAVRNGAAAPRPANGGGVAPSYAPDAPPSAAPVPQGYQPAPAACGCETDVCADECECESWLSGMLPCNRCPDAEQWYLFPQDNCSGWKLSGWLAQGVTTNRRNPRNPPGGMGNLPMTFNYRNDQYQLNQLYLIAEKTADTEGCGWAWGGRVDALYGEDYIFTQAAGLETRQNFRNRWNTAEGGGGIGGTGRMGLALPQIYGEVAYNDVSLRVGHFYTIIGYESVMAPSNFFYSHAYTMQYGEPFTHTGALATWKANDRWTLVGGVVNGWDKFDAVTDRPAFLGGATWTSEDETTSLAMSIITGDEDGAAPPILGNRTMYSIVFSQQFAESWQYVLQHDHGWQSQPGDNADWYGINQYLFYTINDCWRAGARAEWFNDQNGTRVFAGDPSFPGHYYALALGLNWTPNPNVILRPEVRWDGYDPHAGALPGLVGAGPYSTFEGDFTRRDMFTAGMDLILRY